ncbi:flagellar assembly protein FliW [Psychrobacillus soli]|uniref:Flagellar assembly factor FliW n=1 Tax=Psychrobacillus soli TaxID=1543965 RepID=A0A544TJL1_9BACI|nr:flagellar assembly protein FliW [Psychrobacillus soli]TQR17650.1 flagellar assembly protein FliW [Psychrobacillus soli]
MKLKTAYMGEVETDSSSFITFEQGIPGFEKERNFILLPIENNEAFHILQSVQTVELAFIVTNPYTITTDYSFELDEATVHALQIQNEKEVAVLAIVSLKETIAQSTINLKAPIIFNPTNQKAKQVILNDEIYSIRHLISSESKKG